MANNGIYYSSGNTLNFTTDNTTWATLSSGGTFVIDTVSGGTYLNLPVSAVTSGTGISTSTTNGLVTITNTSPDQTVVITGGTNIQIVSNYPNFGINFTGTTSSSGDYLPLSGGTVTGGTVFVSGVTANTLSSIDYIDFDLTAATPTHAEGRVHWTDDTKTLQIDTEVTNFMIEVGHQNVVRVRNTTGSPLAKGRLVYINGGSGNRPTVTLANNTGDTTSARTLGFIAEQINDNNNGYVVTYGLLRGTVASPLDTSSYSAGTQLYLLTGGTFTNVRPVAPYHEVRVGVVIASNANVGVIFVTIMNGYEFQELHDVYITGKTNGDLVTYNSTSGLWENTKTLNGSYQITGTLTASTVSATTYQNLPGSSNSNCFTTFYVTNISGCSPVNIMSPVNITEGITVTGTSTFTNQVNFTGGMSASTFSAATYQSLPVSAVTNGTGISTSTSNGLVTVTNSAPDQTVTISGGTGITTGGTYPNFTITNSSPDQTVVLNNGSGISTSGTYPNFTITNTQVQGITGKTDGTGISSSISNNVITITNTDLGSSQNIFKNIQIAGVTQFSAGSNSSDLNFSGVNVTITSAATNTLVFSAATGGVGTVTSVALSAGTSGTDVNISNSTVTTSGTITINIPDASATARGVVTTGAQTFAGVKTLTSPSLLGTPTAPTADAEIGRAHV